MIINILFQKNKPVEYEYLIKADNLFNAQSFIEFYAEKKNFVQQQQTFTDIQSKLPIKI